MPPLGSPEARPAQGDAPLPGELLPLFAEALVHQTQDRPGSALLAYRRLLQRAPHFPDAWSNLAGVLRELGRPAEALEACERALELAPRHALAWVQLGRLKEDARDYPAALEAYRWAVAHASDSPPALSSLGGLLARLGRLEEALEADDRALALFPANPELLLNRGYTLMRALRLEEAEADLTEALARAPGLARARWNLAYTRLLQGRWQEAWPDFRARLEVPEARENLRELPQPRWDGSPFPGRTLFVWVEQGFGDTLQFARCLAAAKALGGQVVAEAYPALRPLLASCAGPDRWVGVGDPPPPCDLQIPLLDLPALLGEPRPVAPYLACPPDFRPETPLLRALDGAAGQRLRVGLCWAGNPAHVDDHNRSIPAALLAPLAAWPDVDWYSVQVGGPPERPPIPGLVDLAPELASFTETAYALERLDLLVSVDTSVAHLAGALGRPVLLLLPFFPDWRWQARGDSTPWYPSFRIFRQARPGDWSSLLDNLFGELR